MVVGGVVISEVDNWKVKHLSLMYYSFNYEMTFSTMIIVDSNLFVFFRQYEPRFYFNKFNLEWYVNS